MTRQVPVIEMPQMDTTRRNRVNSSNSEESSSSRDSPAITNLAQGEFFMDKQQHHQQQQQQHYNGASGSGSNSSAGTNGRDRECRRSASGSPDPIRASSCKRISRENSGSGKSTNSNGGSGGTSRKNLGGNGCVSGGNGSGKNHGHHHHHHHHHPNSHHNQKDSLSVTVKISHASSTNSMDHHHRTPSPSPHGRHLQRMNRSKGNPNHNHSRSDENSHNNSNNSSNFNIVQTSSDNCDNDNSMQPPDPSKFSMGRRRSSMPNVTDASFLAIPTEETRGSKLRRVRSFKTTSKGAVVNRGDSFKKKSTHSLRSAGSNTTDARQLLQHQLLLQQQLQMQQQQQLQQIQQAAAAQELVDDPYAVEVAPSIPTYFRIIMMGGVGTGKSTLAKQFMTSDFVDNTEDNPEGTQEMTVSVLLDGEESTIEVFDPVSRNVIQEGLEPLLDAYVVVFAINDHPSFDAVQELVRYLRVDFGTDRVILLVGNKTDLVRKRKVSAEEARLVAETYDCKYTETSASLNHGVDELLVGILTQIRLHMRLPFTTIFFPGKGQHQKDDRENHRSCKGPRKFFSRLFRRSSRKKLRECENLHSL